MATVSRKGKGKAIRITIDAFQNNANPETNLTIADAYSNPKLKTTLSDAGLKKLKAHILRQFKELILERSPIPATSRPTRRSTGRAKAARR